MNRINWVGLAISCLFVASGVWAMQYDTGPCSGLVLAFGLGMGFCSWD